MKGMDYTDADRAVFKEEFDGWLPDRIFDVHTHLFPAAAFKPGSDDGPKSIYNKFGGQHTIEQFMDITGRLLPGRKVESLSFGTPGLNIDIEKSSEYSGAISDHKTHFALSLITPQCRIEDVRRRIEKYDLLGYKPYRNMVKGKKGDEVEIFDMLTAEQLEYANEKGLILMMHIPKSLRIADPVNQKQMLELCDRYPNIKVIFAHIGRAYFMRCIEGMLDGIASRPNAYVDTSPCCQWEVLEYTFNHFPRERIMFASDAPVGWVRGKQIEVNHQYAYLVGEDYRVGSALYDAERVLNYTFFFYEQLRAAKKAAKRLGLSRREIENYFYNTASTLVKSVDAHVHRNKAK